MPHKVDSCPSVLHGAPEQQLRNLRQWIEGARPVPIADNAILVFVCGGSTVDSARPALIAYCKSRPTLTHLSFFRAEDVLEIGPQVPAQNLLQREGVLASYSDCVVIVVESAGTIAELGAFANHSELAKRLLVITSAEHEHSPSFIRRGPLQHVDTVSVFGKTIFCKLKPIGPHLAPLETRLAEIARHRLQHKPTNFSELLAVPSKYRLFYIVDLISLLSPIRHDELIAVLIFLHGQASYNLHDDLRLANELHWTSIDGQYHCATAQRLQLFIQLPPHIAAMLRAAVVGRYQRVDRSRCRTLIKRAGP